MKIFTGSLSDKEKQLKKMGVVLKLEGGRANRRRVIKQAVAEVERRLHEKTKTPN